MAYIQIADIYDPLQFASKAQEAQIEKNAFIQSGVMAPDSQLSALCSMAGYTGEFDQIKPLTVNEPDYMTDVNTDLATPDKLGTQQMKYMKAARAKQWEWNDLARGIALTDPVNGITSRIGHYWAVDNQRRLIQSMVGILKDNVANYNSDMLVDVSNDDAGPATDAEKASAKNFIEALALKGDMDNIAAIAMHSTVYYGLRALRQIVDNHDPVTDTSFATFEGKRVIVDDGLPADAGTNRVTFTSILFGAGAVSAGEGNMPSTVPSEVYRDPKAGNGAGAETLFSRRTDIIMPNGFSFVAGAVAGQSATYAELANAANWTRVWEAKNIPVSFLKTNG